MDLFSWITRIQRVKYLEKVNNQRIWSGYCWCSFFNSARNLASVGLPVDEPTPANTNGTKLRQEQTFSCTITQKAWEWWINLPNEAAISWTEKPSSHSRWPPFFVLKTLSDRERGNLLLLASVSPVFGLICCWLGLRLIKRPTAPDQ